MHTHDLSPWTHDHRFGHDSRAAESRTRWVVLITAAMMVFEIVAGWLFNSMALLADGWHMSSHVVAIGLSWFSYALARRHSSDLRYAFGTWKVEVLGGFASAVMLLAVAAIMLFESLARLVVSSPIQYQEALPVAVLGLVVNLLCARILSQREHTHGHSHGPVHEPHGAIASRDHHDGHGHAAAHEHDPNLRSAYVHVLADALTSVLAIAALAGGWRYGWRWLDPAVGAGGAVFIALWARRLLIDAGSVLLDREMDHPVVEDIRRVLEHGDGADANHITDLHVWRVAPGAYACALTVLTHDATLDADAVRARLAALGAVAHSTIEVHRCA